MSLQKGRISLAHARIIVEAGDRITRPELIADYEASVLGYAEAESASRLRSIAKRRAEWYLDETIRERHAAAARTRNVRVYDVDDPFDAVTLAGHGPIDPDTARELTRHAPGWDRILTHPISGAVLAVDRYQPNRKMRRLLTVRDRHCRFPGCRQSTARSDIDHTVAWADGGRTEIENLGHLCRRHHTLKHHTPWSVVQKPGGVLEWTSSTGRVYPDHPASGVHFTTDPEFDAVPF